MLQMRIDTNFIRQVGPLKWAVRSGAIQFRKRILRADTFMRLPTGRTILLPRRSRSATEVYVTAADIDWGSETLFASFARREADFLDIGAHIGYYSAYLSPLVNRVYAFEPDDRNLPALHSNARSAGNVHVCEMAVSSQDGMVVFVVAADDSATSHVANSQSGRADMITVRSTTVDSFVANVAGINIGLVKTDVEGHDLEVLRGMTSAVRTFEPLILSEVGGQVAPLLDLCEAWRYRIYAFTRHCRTLKTRFQMMVSRDLETEWFKMLFLVPERLNRYFLDLAE
jgi:FkbM family methyltransferase